MVPRKLNYEKSLNFFQGAFDLNIHVFIDVRKQTRQKMEGISASQF